MTEDRSIWVTLPWRRHPLLQVGIKMSTEPTLGSAAESDGTTGGAQADIEALPLDVVFDILSNQRRRLVIRELNSRDGSTTLSDLAEHIAALENDKSESELSSDERKRVYICLYQSHLPKMDDADVIDFESDRKTVEIGPTMDQITSYLPEVADEESKRGWATQVAELANAASHKVHSP